MVRRLVGFLEYGMALDYLDELVRRATPEELGVIDEIVAEQTPFAVYSNLSRAVEAPGSTLRERTSAGDDSQRRGLAWVMALARVELGAMLAAFTGFPEPFEMVRPTPFEFSAYRSLLLDGARTHYWALARDPDLQRASRTNPTASPLVLSYSRRLVLARAMTRAAIKSGVARYSAQQLSELASWKNDLDAIQAGLVLLIQSYLQSQTQVSTSTKSTDFLQACGALLRAEKRALREGTAYRQTYGD